MNKKPWKTHEQSFFAEDLFPAIDEVPFRVLYSTAASRSNTLVNICIGALIIKEIFGISDAEVVENLMLAPRYQYALHITSHEEQPLSDQSLSRFRKRCYDYESTYGIDLLHECITSLADKIVKVMEITPRIKWMDSMMIATIIRKDSSSTDTQFLSILQDADRLWKPASLHWKILQNTRSCCLSEQTAAGENGRRLRTKEDGASIQAGSNPLLTRMQLSVRKPGKNIRDMWPTWRKALGKMAQWSQSTSMSKIPIVTVSF